MQAFQCNMVLVFLPLHTHTHTQARVTTLKGGQCSHDDSHQTSFLAQAPSAGRPPLDPCRPSSLIWHPPPPPHTLSLSLSLALSVSLSLSLSLSLSFPDVGCFTRVGGSCTFGEHPDWAIWFIIWSGSASRATLTRSLPPPRTCCWWTSWFWFSPCSLCPVAFGGKSPGHPREPLPFLFAADRSQFQVPHGPQLAEQPVEVGGLLNLLCAPAPVQGSHLCLCCHPLSPLHKSSGRLCGSSTSAGPMGGAPQLDRRWDHVSHEVAPPSPPPLGDGGGGGWG